SPGALCGLVGLKPTLGRVSCNGVIPLSWSLDHPGPIARSVYDAAVLLGGMAGWDPHDPASVDVAVPDYLATLHDGVRGLRIAVDPAYAFSSVDPEVEATVHQALSVLEVLGAELVEVRLARLGEAHEAPLVILLAEAAAYHEDFLRTRPDDYEPGGPRIRLEQALTIPGPEYARARRAGQWIRRDFELLFQDADLFALPTCAIPAPRIGQTDTQIRGQTQTVLASLTRFTRIFNLVGGPAITVPCGFSEGGLPIGLQLVGRHWDEATLLRAAYAYEQATNWRRRRPAFGEQAS
ncbi:MAG TPA: amidase, partial [Ardenticatenaceae bacterium]|nr:amidase [Ardenticatenaceae bacterium]